MILPVHVLTGKYKNQLACLTHPKKHTIVKHHKKVVKEQEYFIIYE